MHLKELMKQCFAEGREIYKDNFYGENEEELNEVWDMWWLDNGLKLLQEFCSEYSIRPSIESMKKQNIDTDHE